MYCQQASNLAQPVRDAAGKLLFLLVLRAVPVDLLASVLYVEASNTQATASKSASTCMSCSGQSGKKKMQWEDQSTRQQIVPITSMTIYYVHRSLGPS